MYNKYIVMFFERQDEIFLEIQQHFLIYNKDTWWFKYDRDDLCVNKSQFVPVIFEPPCIFMLDGRKYELFLGRQQHNMMILTKA